MLVLRKGFHELLISFHLNFYCMFFLKTLAVKTLQYDTGTQIINIVSSRSPNVKALVALWGLFTTLNHHAESGLNSACEQELELPGYVSTKGKLVMFQSDVVRN